MRPIRFFSLFLMIPAFLSAVPLLSGAPEPGPTRGAEATASKAAFLFNLSRFIEWQDPQAVVGDSPIIFAVMEDDSLGPALKEMLESKGLNGQVLVIRDESQVKAAREFFNVFSFPGQDAVTASRVLDELKGSRVLTVSEARDFLERGGMVQVEMTGDSMQFKVNEKMLAAEGLKAAPAIRRMAGTTIVSPGRDPRQMYEAWRQVFDRAQEQGGGLPVPSGLDEDVPVLERVLIALRWIGALAGLFTLAWAWRRFAGTRKRRKRHG